MSRIGKTLAHYEITSKLGKGGMGKLCQAKDQKLGRDVAIKVLPGEFAKDADRVARFQRDAKSLPSLNHSNIAAIYGAGRIRWSQVPSLRTGRRRDSGRTVEAARPDPLLKRH
jgi:serine/threonine protein kinase